MKTTIPLDFQSKEQKVLALIETVHNDDPELAKCLEQTLAIMKRSNLFKVTSFDYRDYIN